MNNKFTRTTSLTSFSCIYLRFLADFMHCSGVFNFDFAHLSVMPATGTPRRIDVDSTWILWPYVKDQISTNFHAISTYFFDVISLIKKSRLFPRTFFGVTSMVKKSTLFLLTFFDVILTVEWSTLFARTFFDEISTGRNSTSFMVKLQANENFH